MPETPFKVCVINGHVERDFTDCITELSQIGTEVSILPFMDEESEIIEATRGAHGLIVTKSKITRRIIETLKNLRVIVRTGVGFDVIDTVAATELGIAVVNIPDLWIREVANHTLGLLLAWNRKIIVLNQEVKSGKWETRVPGWTGCLHGETIGIVGLGNIGSAFAERIAALDMKIIAHDPYVADSHFESLKAERVSMKELAERSDYVSVHCLFNEETHHIINTEFLSQMKTSAFLINTARGPVVDEQALIRALESQKIAGAALDVLESEPPAENNPLLKMENVILTSHAGYFSNPSAAQVPKRCGEETARVLKGERPLHLVNPEIY
ncbi:MAG: C-terminal binding protein [SAR324 cluster bacterium]|nr:C-terminal binding protein [SAR324 cluster bacterium]